MDSSPADQMYDSLHDVFGTGGNELFAMEWPGRVLDEATYAYPVENVFSELVRPQPVIEAEFRLSDGMIDVAPLVAGPNGSLLSVAYTEALNQLVPAYTGAMAAYQADKEKFRAWLLEKVSVQWVGDDGKPVFMKDASRIEVYDALNQRYLDAMGTWNALKTAKLVAAQEAADSLVELEAYAKWLAEEAPAVKAQLESKFADLVAKGYYHEVRSAISSLDIATPGEALEAAKMRMRASSMSSLDESETIYPVQFSPQDWFKGLSTDFTSEDLLLDPMMLQGELTQKQQQIEQLEDQITFLEAAHTGNEKDLQAKVDDAQTALDGALTSLTDAYAANVVTAAKMYFASTKKKPGATTAPAQTKDGVNQQLGSQGPISDADFAALQAGFDKVDAAQAKLTAAGRDLVDLQAAEMQAKTSDSAQLVASLRAQVAALQAQVQSLQATLFSPQSTNRMQQLATTDTDGKVTYDPTKDPNIGTDKDGKFTYPLLPTPMPSPGEFFDVIVESSWSKTQQSSSLEASASQRSWNVDVFFGSASGSSSSSQSTSSFDLKSEGGEVKIGFRAMKVTMDRGGWFDPTPFNDSEQLYHLGADDPDPDPAKDPSKDPDKGYELISQGPPPAPFDYKSADAAKTLADLRKSPLPAYPTAFLVVKDVTISISLSSEDTAKRAAAAASSSSDSGGIFCFAVSGSSSSSSSSQSASTVAVGKNVIIKIPGPQILGWFLEYVHADKSKRYEAMPTDYLPPTAAPLSVAADMPALAQATRTSAAAGDGGGALTDGSEPQTQPEIERLVADMEETVNPTEPVLAAAAVVNGQGDA